MTPRVSCRSVNAAMELEIAAMDLAGAVMDARGLAMGQGGTPIYLRYAAMVPRNAAVFPGCMNMDWEILLQLWIEEVWIRDR
jgi:hypothetical protein